MAALADLAPATGSVNVLPDAPVTFRVTNATDIDLSLVELTIGTRSCTVANGLLLPWNTRDASGATVVDNLTDVYFTSTGLRWYTGSVEVTAEVIYDSVSLGTTTWTASEDDGSLASAVGTLQTYATSRTSDEATVTGFYHVQIQSLLTTLDGSFAVQEWALGMYAAGQYWVAHPYYTDALASGVVALPYLYDHLASGAVHGYSFSDHLANGAVQGWFIVDALASAAIGIRFLFDHLVSAQVGAEHYQDHLVSGSVYGVLRGTVLDIRVEDATTYQAIVDAGVTFS